MVAEHEFEALEFALDWHPDARRSESGGPNWIGVVAVGTSLGIVEGIEIETMAAQGCRWPVESWID